MQCILLPHPNLPRKWGTRDFTDYKSVSSASLVYGEGTLVPVRFLPQDSKLALKTNFCPLPPRAGPDENAYNGVARCKAVPRSLFSSWIFLFTFLFHDKKVNARRGTSDKK